MSSYFCVVSKDFSGKVGSAHPEKLAQTAMERKGKVKMGKRGKAEKKNGYGREMGKKKEE